MAKIPLSITIDKPENDSVYVMSQDDVTFDASYVIEKNDKCKDCKETCSPKITWYPEDLFSDDKVKGKLPFGSHVLTCVVHTNDKVEKSTCIAFSGGAPMKNTPEDYKPCVVHVLDAKILWPPDSFSMSKSNVLLKARAPGQWGLKIDILKANTIWNNGEIRVSIENDHSVKIVTKKDGLETIKYIPSQLYKFTKCFFTDDGSVVAVDANYQGEQWILPDTETGKCYGFTEPTFFCKVAGSQKGTNTIWAINPLYQLYSKIKYVWEFSLDKQVVYTIAMDRLNSFFGYDNEPMLYFSMDMSKYLKSVIYTVGLRVSGTDSKNNIVSVLSSLREVTITE